jgi:general secretion pathway protein E
MDGRSPIDLAPAAGDLNLIFPAEGPFLEHLVAEGHLKPKDRERVLTFAQEGFIPILNAVARLGLVPERQLATLIAEFLDLPLVARSDYPDIAVLNGPSLRYLKKNGILPLELTDDRLTVAVVNPFDESIVQAFRLLTGKPVALRIGSPAEIDAELQRLYAGGRSEVEDIITDLDSDTSLSDTETQRLKEMAGEAPIVRLLNALIARAVEKGASDIHIESYETAVSLRYRIDGVLQDAESPPQQIGRALVSRIKILARLNIAERRLPQDGRVKMPVLGKLIDFRVSIVPTLHGERIVMRILDHDQSPKTLDGLGMNQADLTALKKLLRRPNGIFLVTGPTGSGKTTTLYAALQALPIREKNVITVEDPIEYQIDGVNQIQIKPAIGLNFASILRSILRQDPDIIMIGEIRDPETADIAVHAALTGHLVLSTLHTSSAAGAITRILDMGIQGYLLVSALEGVLAQRLVRRLCDQCKIAVELADIEIRNLGLGFVAEDEPIRVFRPGGCPACGHTGFRGRAVVTDLLVVNEAIRSLVLRGASSQEIEAVVFDQNGAFDHSGPRGLRRDGLRLVAQGLTSLEELFSVIEGLD